MPTAVRSGWGISVMAAADKDWLIPPDPELMDWDGDPMDRTSDIGRLVYRTCAEFAIEDAFQAAEDPDVRYLLSRVYNALRHYSGCCEAVISRHEAKVRSEPFRRLHRQLTGMGVQFAAFARKRPEQPCGAFKARQVNSVLRPLRELLEGDGVDIGESLPLVSETEEYSYGDVLLVLQSYLDVSADYAARHFDGQPPEIPPLTRTFQPRLIRSLILDFCVDEPKTLLEIGRSLGYRDKKTIHKYVDPLLASGCLVRTVPDRPSSRNQKYITARFS